MTLYKDATLNELLEDAIRTSKTNTTIDWDSNPSPVNDEFIYLTHLLTQIKERLESHENTCTTND